MSHQITITYTRPTTDVGFYRHDSAYSAWFNANFISTGKFVKAGLTSSDPLTEVWSGEWTDDAARATWLASAETASAMARRNEYLAANGISMNISATDHD